MNEICTTLPCVGFVGWKWEISHINFHLWVFAKFPCVWFQRRDWKFQPEGGVSTARSAVYGVPRSLDISRGQAKTNKILYVLSI